MTIIIVVGTVRNSYHTFGTR